MQILFPLMPYSTEVDPDFAAEYEAAAKAGFDVGLIDIDLVNGSSPGRVLRNLHDDENAIYRGWMLKPTEYLMLYDKLAARGVELINTPHQYQSCHYFPGWYNKIDFITPRSIVFPRDDQLGVTNLDAVALVVQQEFAGQGVILKDYVKSRKHDWLDACFIPSADDIENVKRVTQNFWARQDVQGGLVFREYEPLIQIGTHSQSRLPLYQEYRLFILFNMPFLAVNYWESPAFLEDRPEWKYPPPDHKAMQQIVDYIIGLGGLPKIQSNFYTVDIAATEAGTWRVMEIGDGQVSGLQSASADIFYDKMSFDLKQGRIKL